MNKSSNPNNSNGAPQPDEELRQQLWELSYGLLDDDVAASLRARIKSEPALARLYAEVRLQADLVATASRVQDGSLHISAGPDSKVGKGQGKERGSVRGQKATLAAHGPAGWATNWLAIGGTVALLLLLTFGLLRPDAFTGNNNVAQVDPSYFYTIVSTPPAVEGLPQVVELQTYDVHDKARAEELEVRLIDSEGRQTYRATVSTSDKGRALAELPGDAIHPGSRIEVIPADQRGDMSRTVAAPLKVAEEPRHTLMLFSTPTARPGEKVEFSMVEVTENTKRALLPSADELMVESDGKDVVRPMWTANPDTKVINGEWETPLDAETEGLAVRRNRGAVADVKQKADEKEEGKVSAKDAAVKEQNRVVEKYYLSQPEADRAARKASTLERAIDQQQRTLAARRNEEETLRKSATGPAPKSGEVAAANLNGAGVKPGEAGQSPNFGAQLKPASDVPAADKSAGPGGLPGAAAGTTTQLPKGGPVAPAVVPPAPAQAAPGAFSPAPIPLAPAPAPPRPSEPALPEIQPSPPAGPKAQAANQPAVNDAPTNRPEAAKGEEGNAPSRSVAAADGNSGRQKNETKKMLDDVGAQENQQIGGQLAKQRGPEEGPWPGSVSGRPAASPEGESLAFGAQAKTLSEVPLGRQLGVQASPTRGFKLHVEGLQAGYAPGQKVELSIRVADEEDRPVSANVGVRVWNEKDARASKAPLSLTDALAYESLRDVAKSKSATFQESAENAGAFAYGAGFGGGGGGAPAGAAGPNGGAQTDTRRGFAGKRDQEALAANQPTTQPATTPAPAPGGYAPPANQPGQAEVHDIDGPYASPLSPSDEKLNEIAPGELIEADNRAQVQRDYELAIAAARMQRSDQWQTMGRVLIWSSAGMLVVLGLLMIARQPVRTGVLIPAVALCMVCLTVGIAWFVPAQPAGVQVAYSPAPPNATKPVMAPAVDRPSEVPAPVENSSQDAPEPTGGYGRFAGANARDKLAEGLKSLDGSVESASGQGQGGLNDPAATNRTAGDEQKPATAGAAKAEVRSQDLRSNRNGAARSEPFRETEGAPSDPATFDKPLMQKSAAGSLEAAKSGPPAPAPATKPESVPLATLPEKPNAAPRATPGASPSAPGGSGGGGGFRGAPSAGAAMPEGRGGAGLGGGEKKLAQTRLQDQPGLGNSGLDRSGSDGAPPAALYWRPLSPVDKSGVIKIEFTMPAAESEYRLLIDAIGNGRIGSTQQLILCREAK